MVLKKIFLLVIFSLILAGCGSLGSRVSGEYEFDSSESKGLVAFSTHLRQDCSSDVVGFHIFGSAESGFDEMVPVKNFLMKPDLGDNGYFLVYELDEGDYTMGKVSVAGFAMAARYSENENILRFRVHQGRVSYLGQIEFNIVSGCHGVTTTVADKWNRDVELFKKRIPNIPVETVTTELAVVNQQQGL